MSASSSLGGSTVFFHHKRDGGWLQAVSSGPPENSWGQSATGLGGSWNGSSVAMEKTLGVSQGSKEVLGGTADQAVSEPAGDSPIWPTQPEAPAGVTGRRQHVKCTVSRHTSPTIAPHKTL